jgi:hypothetical protein
MAPWPVSLHALWRSSVRALRRKSSPRGPVPMPLIPEDPLSLSQQPV